MKIESLIRRPNGTEVELDGEHYHFRPTETDERHQAEVAIESHIRRFLSIPEGYRPLDGEAAPIADLDVTPRSSKVHPAQFTLVNGDTITLEELTSRAFKACGLQLSEWNAQEDQDLYDHLEVTLAEINAEITERGGPVSDYVPDGQDVPEQLVIGPDGGDADDDSEDDGEDGDDPEAKQGGETQAPETAQALDRDQLAAAFKARFGKAPHGRLSAERIYEILKEDGED